MPPKPGPALLYRCYSAQSTLLYVGITQDFGHRMAAHNREDRWWRQVRWMTLDVYPSYAAAYQAEGVAILKERPVHNDSRNPRRKR